MMSCPKRIAGRLARSARYIAQCAMSSIIALAARSSGPAMSWLLQQALVPQELDERRFGSFDGDALFLVEHFGAFLA